MAARFATEQDAAEIVRLATVMYRSMGIIPNLAWITQAERSVQARLGKDLQVAVVDAPDGAGLAASAAVVVAQRLPAPNNLTGSSAYFQWVATDERMRRRGFATAAMRLLIVWCAEQDVPLLELHATPDGEPVYTSLGFGTDGPVAMRMRIQPS